MCFHVRKLGQPGTQTYATVPYFLEQSKLNQHLRITYSPVRIHTLSKSNEVCSVTVIEISTGSPSVCVENL